jgi:NADH:quinone reductase (non-electrogenic)
MTSSPREYRKNASRSGAAPTPRVVVLGAGFGGLFAARGLARAPVEVIVVDRHNYHLFQPLLYQVAVAALPPSDIAWPVRSILSRQKNAVVLLDEVRGVDLAERHVLTRHAEIAFDYLVIATGSTHSYFGHSDWELVAPGLKTIDDATRIRRSILEAFERAEMTRDAAERRRLLTFVIVGAGPTGVELAGTIAELAQRTLVRDFRRIDPRSARIVLVEAGPNVLAAFDPKLRDYARLALERLGVEVRVGVAVTGCDAAGVTLDAERIESETVIWAAGVQASPVGAWLGVATERGGKVAVAGDLSVPGLRDVFVIGDAAQADAGDGTPVPGIAPAAKQQGRYVAGLIARRVRGAAPQSPFRYRHGGYLATIGRQAAVIEWPFLRLKGWPAWWIWGIAHIYFLVGVPSPLVVSLRWLWEYLTHGRGARLITGAEHAD